MNKKYDVIVIGAGAAGITAAFTANTLGAKTLLIEKRRIGGDCTWFGCIPSKTLLKSAHIAQSIKTSSQFGINHNIASLDTQGVMDHVRETIEKIAHEERPEIFRQKGIDVIFGEAQFVNTHTIVVNNETFEFKKCILSVGSYPAIPAIPGLQTIPFLTNETIFDLTTLPRDLIVLGGGPIGVELTQGLNRLGVHITLVEMVDRILFREEKELAAYIEKKLISEGVTIYTGYKATKAQSNDGRITVTLEAASGEGKDITAERILVALGRAPQTEGLALEKANIKYSRRGVSVNDHLQTTNPNVFAGGDIVGPYQFSHIANYHGQIAVRNALFKKIAWQKVNYSNISWATFTDPELAHCGLTEAEARKQYKKIQVYTTEYSACDRAVTDNEKGGLLKIIIDKKGFLLGAHIVGAQAGEIIHPLIIAKALKIRVAKLAQLVYIYPTLSELIRKITIQPLVSSLDNPFIQWTMELFKTKWT